MPTTQTEAKNVKKGRYVVIDEEPCKVTNISTSKPGKHGSTKVRIKAVSISDGKNKELTKPASADVEVPMIDKRRAQVVSLSGDSAHLMDMESYETFETSIPEDIDVSEGEEVSYWEVMGKKIVKG